MKLGENKQREKGYGLKFIGFCGGQVSAGLEAVVIGQLTYYLTESVHMAAAVVGVLLLCTRIFDGFTDAVAGFLVDRTRSKWGKARPYTLLFIPMWIALVLIFSVPEISLKLQIAYVFIMYIIIEAIGRTFIICIQSVLLKRAVYEEDQVKYLSMSALATYLFGLIAGAAMPILISIFGQTKTGWTIIALIFAIPGTILGLLQFLLVKEFPIEQKDVALEKKVPFVTGLKALSKNKYIFIFGIVIFIFNISSAIGSASTTYYFNYIIGDIAKLTVVSLISFLSLSIMFVLPKLQAKYGAKKVIVVGLWVTVLASFARYLFPTNIIMLGILAAIGGAGSMPLFTLMNVISIDCMKYSYWQTGIPIEGVISSVNGVATKIGAGLGAVSIGLLMGMSGYDGALAVQSDSALGMIKFLYIGLPAICCIIGLIAMHFYTLDKKLPEIEAELDKRARGAKDE